MITRQFNNDISQEASILGRSSYNATDPAVWITLISESEARTRAQALITQYQSLPPSKLPQLYGIPFSVKDSIDISNLPTTPRMSFLHLQSQYHRVRNQPPSHRRGHSHWQNEPRPIRYRHNRSALTTRHSSLRVRSRVHMRWQLLGLRRQRGGQPCQFRYIHRHGWINTCSRVPQRARRAETNTRYGEYDRPVPCVQ